MDGYLVGEYLAVTGEPRPGTVSPVGMDAVEESHARPQDDVLRLRGGETLAPSSGAHAREGGAEERAVGEMRREAGRPPALPVTGEKSPEQPDVGVARGRPDEPGHARLNRRPEGRGGRSRERSSPHA